MISSLARSLLHTVLLGTFVSAVWFLFLLAIPGPAEAHVPILEPPGDQVEGWEDEAALFPDAVTVPTPEVSRAVYGTLAPDDEFDAYRFSVEETITVPIRLLVPAEDELRDFRPSFALVGSGIESGGEPPRFVREAVAGFGDSAGGAEDLGVRVIRHAPGERPTFFEPFTLETYWEGAEAQVTLLPGASYHLLVWDEPDRESSLPYVFGLGEVERFGFGDALDSIGAIVRLKLGLYGQEEFQWGWFVLLSLVAGGLLGAIVLLGRWLVRR